MLLSGCVTSTSLTTTGSNIMVLGEDYPAGSIIRGSSAYHQIENAIVDELTNAGYAVFDETAVSAGQYAQGRKRRSSAELIDMARSIRQPPIDVLVVFTAYSQVRSYDYTNKLKTRIEGRILQVNSGRVLGNFDLTAPVRAVAPDCQNYCLSEVQVEQAHSLALDLAAIIAQKLASPTGQVEKNRNFNAESPNQYVLSFEGFSSDELLELESHIIGYSGYQQHRLSSQGHTYNEIWYETKDNAAQLNRDLKQSLQNMGIRNMLQLDNNHFLIKKITQRRSVKPAPVKPSADYEW